MHCRLPQLPANNLSTQLKKKKNHLVLKYYSKLFYSSLMCHVNTHSYTYHIIQKSCNENNKYVTNTPSMNRMSIQKLNKKGYITYSLETQYLSEITCHKTNYLSPHTGRIQECKKIWKPTHNIYLMAIRIEATLHHNFCPSHN